MLSGNFIYKGESKAGTAHGTASGLVHPEKWIKDSFLKFRRNTNSGVCYLNKSTVS